MQAFLEWYPTMTLRGHANEENMLSNRYKRLDVSNPQDTRLYFDLQPIAHELEAISFRIIS
jgi:hypothetical protein